jgi:hypothetical protein
MGQESLALASSGLSLITLSLGLLLRRFIGDRIAWSVAGLATLFVWTPKPFEIFLLGNIEMFVISGVFMVTSLLIVVMFNSTASSVSSPPCSGSKVDTGRWSRPRSPIPEGEDAHRAEHLHLWAGDLHCDHLSMMSGMLAVGIPQMVEETSGGFDIVAFSNAPVDMHGAIASPGAWWIAGT